MTVTKHIDNKFQIFWCTHLACWAEFFLLFGLYL